MRDFLTNSFDEIWRCCNSLDYQSADEFVEFLKTFRNGQQQIHIIGNGGSASIATHMATDFSKTAGLPVRYLGDHNYLTCVGNDYGFDEIYAKGVEWYGHPGDLLIAISSSGNSENIVRGVKSALSKRLKVATFSGFRADNAIRDLGNWNFWVGSEDYNVVEMVHHIWLARFCDFIGSECE